VETKPIPDRPPRRERVALLSPCGWGNLGDAAIIDSLIQGVRRRRPDTEIIAFTMNARDTARRHGVPAFPCSGYSPRHYGVTQAEATADDIRGASPGSGEAVRVAPPAVAPGPRPAVRPIRRLREILWMVRAEVRQRRAAARLVEGCAFVIVAGGGQLDEFWGGPLGHPYVLARWSRLARDHGARFVVLSVGTGTLRSWLSRWFVTQALAESDYRSFRDAGSRELVRSLYPGVAEDAVVPDLAYALPVATTRLPSLSGRPMTIGIAPIAEGEARVWPVADPGRYHRHLEASARLAELALAAGTGVRIFSTDGPDRGAASLLYERVRQATGGSELLSLHDTTTLPELMATLESVDIVVAARLHAILLAHLKGRPTLALSYERKVETLMREFDLAEFCVPIRDLDPEKSWALVGRLGASLQGLSRDLLLKVASRRSAVETQYDRLFGAAQAGG
jgi:polysaccharide pyruvyl transferase WcaK-like protein